MGEERKSRRHFTGGEKVALLRRHLVERVAVSELCDEVGLQPTVFYRWLKEFFENGAAAFDTKGTKRQLGREQERIEALEAKLRRKDEVLSELMEEHIALKKVLGRSEGGLGSAGHARRRDGLCAPVVGQVRDRCWPLHQLVGRESQQVLSVARPVWQGA